MATKTVLITGANRGIGLSFVRHYVKAGWVVIATARNLANADALNALNPTKIVALDAGDEASILAAAKELEGTPIDLLINNAAVAGFEPFDKVTKKQLIETFEVNAIGPLLLTRALEENLRLAASASGSVKVITISSLVASTAINTGGHFDVLDTLGIGGRPAKAPLGGLYAYRASKAAANMITTNLAVDLRADNIIVVAIHPGLVGTDMNKRFDANADTDSDLINEQFEMISPDESAARMAKHIDGLTEEHTAKFYDVSGAELPW